MGTDPGLVGHWLSGPFEVGVMEDSELGLLPDGRGWSALATSSGALEVTRLRWSRPYPGELVLREEWSLTGTWTVDEGFAPAGLPEPSNGVLRTSYVLGREPAVSGGLRHALRLARPVEFCELFALSARPVVPSLDPSHRHVPYAGT